MEDRVPISRYVCGTAERFLATVVDSRRLVRDSVGKSPRREHRDGGGQMYEKPLGGDCESGASDL